MDVIRETAFTIANAPLCRGGNIEDLLPDRLGNRKHLQ